MKIESFTMEQNAQSIQFAEQRQVFVADTGERRVIGGIQLNLSNAASKEVSGETLFKLSDEDQQKMELLERLISMITGKPFRFQQRFHKDAETRKSKEDVGKSADGLKISDKSSPLSAGLALGVVGVQPLKGIRITETYESESMQFQSKGMVHTADGKTINFELNLGMSRKTYQKTVEFGVLHDPLVLNFDGRGAAFGEDTIKMDLNLDGVVDTFNMLNSGSGFLTLDKNGNGKVDDGSELFGPKTGSGFAELAAYDSDGNGWIDESDAIFESLKIWTVSPTGDQTLIGLKEAGVGAFYLTSVASPYQIKSGGALQGMIQSTGTYLRENGLAGAIHEIDIKI